MEFSLFKRLIQKLYLFLLSHTYIQFIVHLHFAWHIILVFLPGAFKSKSSKQNSAHTNEAKLNK